MQIVEFNYLRHSFIEVYIYLHNWMTQMETNGTGDWFSIVDALDELKISRRTLYHKINKGELQSKKEGKFRFVWIDDTIDLGNDTYTDTNETQTNSNLLDELKGQVAYFKGKVEQLETDMRQMHMQHNATIFKIIEQNQMLLETTKTKSKTPFWKFW